ncbi:MAG: protein-L-isoaspartate(D-aspartate) O-methyltransferase [Deltaproteobacteria bacterium]|nr:protein-L-isoaspartate(D-aspartate) O-methyltransferase [Deltaproteobacteria bacterium]
MVRKQVEARGVRDPRVLQAMRFVSREDYVPEAKAPLAYEDRPLDIGCGQTISQPFIVALMVQALQLRGQEKVLEVGTGSGYGAAVLAHLSREVFTIERLPSLARAAARRLAEDGCHNVHVLEGDGTLGHPMQAPFDAIVVAAGAPQVPEALLSQLAVGGRLVIPVGQDLDDQNLMLVRRLAANEYQAQHLADVRFVPLLGAQGFCEQTTRH